MGDEEAHDHGTTTHDYQHGCDSSSNTCVLKQAVIVPSSQARFVNNCNNCTDNHNHNFFILSNFGYEDLEPFSAVVISIPEISSFFISFVTPTLGLRAPPIA
ncbi:MAG: hypothetical protein CVT92_12825 [Bacteroidetes bacterium HGW-Bacteroidetes-1]|nr:MAG: hypothetical protein CVT92_12825 [Bacteroidetes bacterium HGW-Bacteroidetes-1]